MSTAATTGVQLALDCDPTWTDDYEPSDQPPTPHALRQTEIRDCRGQHAGPYRLWTADTINPGSYL